MTRYKSIVGSLNEHNIIFDIGLGHHHDGIDSRLIDPTKYVTGFIDVAYDPTQVASSGSTFALEKTLHYLPTGSGIYSFYPASGPVRQGDYGFLVRGNIPLIRVFGYWQKFTGSMIPGGYYFLIGNDTEIFEQSNTFTLEKTLAIGTAITGSQTIEVFAEFRNLYETPNYGYTGQWEVFLDNVLLWSGSITNPFYSGSFIGNPVDVTITPTSNLTLYMKGAQQIFPYSGIYRARIDFGGPRSGHGDQGPDTQAQPNQLVPLVEAVNRRFDVWVSAPSGSVAGAGTGGMQIFVSGSKIYQTYTTGSGTSGAGSSNYAAYDTGWINVSNTGSYNGIGDVAIYLLSAFESGSRVQVQLAVNPFSNYT